MKAPASDRQLHAVPRIIVAAAVLVSLATTSVARAEPVTVITSNGPSANRVDFLVLGDGYTAAEIAAGKYALDVNNFVAGVFAQEPYSEYRNYYNVARIDVASVESGADHPATGIFKDTAFDAAYDCSGITRLICINPTKVNAMITASGVAANARDVVLVLVNDTEYGGSGGAIAVASINVNVTELVLHETGHSFALLADEYGGPPPPACVLTEPVNANATRETTRALIKWNAWIDPLTPVPTVTTTNGVPGLYQGAVYCDTGAYRPTFNSKMRSLGLPFHQINVEQHVARIYNLVSPIDTASPAGSVILSGRSQAFSLTVPQPFTHTLSVAWRVDGVLLGTGLAFTATNLTPGQHTVTATVLDATPMVRTDQTGLLNEVRTWTVNTTIPTMVDLNGDANGDAFIYSQALGLWAVENTLPGGGFSAVTGAWGPGWSVTPARFNNDALTDMFLFNQMSGQWFKMLNDGAGGWTTEGFAAWGTNWQRFVVDLNGDGLSDLFLWDPVLGTWFKCLATPGGFTYTQGFWSLGWEVYPMHFNNDLLADFFLFNRTTGQWFWVLGGPGGTFTYPQFAAWAPIWHFYPGDYNGDGLSDLLLHNPATGQFFVALNTIGNFTYVFGTFSTGWTITPMDLDANGRTDLFLHDPANGQWFEMMSNGAGTFTVGGTGAFGLGWILYPTDFNGDGRGDLLLYNPSTGQWAQAMNTALGVFAYTFGAWGTSLTVVAASPGG